MAAISTLEHSEQSRNPSNPPIPSPITPRNGVVTLYGYGIKVRLERGHLTIEDGIGANRRAARFSRVGHGLRRLIVIGADGMVSLAALRWLADQNASFVMLERDGSVLATTSPVRPSDARLRRAQSLAAKTGADIIIARYLIEHKLAGQERVAREKLRDTATADSIAEIRQYAATAASIEAIRHLEAKGAVLYWAAWGELPITFPTKELPRVPEHWRTFGTRKSPLTGSQRLAVNPANAMLNYLYAILESESCLAAAALGLDSGIGFIHVDTPNRDSLACDLMEAVRPQVDGFVLDWIRSAPLKREWFFEERNGNCRLMASFTERLSETATTWSRAIAPFAEWVAQALWTRISKPPSERELSTRLTQSHKREAKGSSFVPPVVANPKRGNICRNCGKSIGRESLHCRACEIPHSTEHLIAGARMGRTKNNTAEAKARRAEKRLLDVAAIRAWQPSSLPAWLDKNAYMQKVLPLLKDIRNSVLMSALGISLPYAVRIRHGQYIPHPRHWQTLALLTGVSEPPVGS